MKGEGFYDRHSSPQWSAIAAVLPWLEEAVGTMDLRDDPWPIVIVDQGCSEGRNSIAAAQRIVTALRQKTTRPIQTVHNDLPTNNFNQLFVNLAPAGHSAFTEANVYSAAVGASLYHQILPPRTATIAMTFNAVGWLEQHPGVQVPDYILAMGPGRPRPGVGVSAEVRNAYADQARLDMERFYQARAEEMIPGGKVLVATFGANEQHRCCDGIYDVLNDALLDLVDGGRLARAAYRRLVFPLYFRSVEELIAPLAQPGSLSRAFRVDRAESMEVPVPFQQQRKETGDAGTYAAAYTSFLRAFTEPVLRLSFHDQADLDALIEETYRGVRSRLTATPEAYELHYIQVAALLTRL
jgi:hypothetical protein